MIKLTTHVLDTTNGTPAEGMGVRLYRIDAQRAHWICSLQLNADGRTDVPLIDAQACLPGRYRLVFEVDRYFRSLGTSLSDPPFLGEVLIDFGIAEGNDSYHVPLLVSPWAYSTYRGS